MTALDDGDKADSAGRDFLREYLSQAPAALALLRAIESREMAGMEFARPILDVGCGDGLFSQVFFGRRPLNEAGSPITVLRRAAWGELASSYGASTCRKIPGGACGCWEYHGGKELNEGGSRGSLCDLADLQ